jgi:hypothetical protein
MPVMEGKGPLHMSTGAAVPPSRNLGIVFAFAEGARTASRDRLVREAMDRLGREAKARGASQVVDVRLDVRLQPPVFPISRGAWHVFASGTATS